MGQVTLACLNHANSATPQRSVIWLELNQWSIHLAVQLLLRLGTLELDVLVGAVLRCVIDGTAFVGLRKQADKAARGLAAGADTETKNHEYTAGSIIHGRGF